MNWLDFTFVGLVVVGAMYGAWKGFVMLASIAVIAVAAIFAAGHFGGPVADFLGRFSDNEAVCGLPGFALVFGAAAAALIVVAYAVRAVLRKVKIGAADHFLGGIVWTQQARIFPDFRRRESGTDAMSGPSIERNPEKGDVHFFHSPYLRQAHETRYAAEPRRNQRVDGRIFFHACVPFTRIFRAAKADLVSQFAKPFIIDPNMVGDFVNDDLADFFFKL